MVELNNLMRSSKEFRRIINIIKSKYIMADMKVPSTARITGMIAKSVDPERIFKDEIATL